MHRIIAICFRKSPEFFLTPFTYKKQEEYVLNTDVVVDIDVDVVEDTKKNLGSLK